MRAGGAHAAYVRAKPNSESLIVSELLPGENFAVLEYAAGWAWGYCAADGIVGYVEAITLVQPIDPTHVVCEKYAPVIADQRVTAPVLAELPMGARLQGEECGACLATEYGCVPLSHLRAVADRDEDPVVVAERLMGTPYLEGGRSAAGIDAGGLIQLALDACGVAVPRLLDRLTEVGDTVPAGAPSRRGDLVLLDDGAGLMIDDLLMIHASRAGGKVTVEPISLHRTTRRRLA